MKIPVAIYRDWINSRKVPSDRKQLANEALNTFEILSARKTIEPFDLEPIIQAAKSPYLVAFDIGTEMLVRLAVNNLTAQSVIREIILGARKENERFRMIAALNNDLPREFTIELLRKALYDKGKRVREKAAAMADTLELKELLPEIDKCLHSESHPITKKGIELHAAMLRDGYLLKKIEDGNYSLTVRINNGWRVQIVKKAEIENGKLYQIIADARSQP